MSGSLTVSIKYVQVNDPSMSGIRIIGLRGGFTFDQAMDHVESLGAEVALLNPDSVCGKDHLVSAYIHAERAFAEGRNRCKKIVTEMILYAAFERQIGRALDAVRPRSGTDAVVAAIIGYDGDLQLEKLHAVEDPSLLAPSAEKARKLGVELFDGVSPEDAVLEKVAFVDLMKQ